MWTVFLDVGSKPEGLMGYGTNIQYLNIGLPKVMKVNGMVSYHSGFTLPTQDNNQLRLKLCTQYTI